MLAVVRKPHINVTLFEVKGDIPDSVMEYLKEEFKQNIEICNDDDEACNIFGTDWYQNIKETVTPGEIVKIYRENLGFTQAELGQRAGEITLRQISDIEANKCSIDKEIAKQFSKIFNLPVEKFL